MYNNVVATVDIVGRFDGVCVCVCARTSKYMEERARVREITVHWSERVRGKCYENTRPTFPTQSQLEKLLIFRRGVVRRSS